MSTSITMYSADWCGDCVLSKRLLDSLEVSYELIDVESVPGASEKVIEINGGKRSYFPSRYLVDSLDQMLNQLLSLRFL